MYELSVPRLVPLHISDHQPIEVGCILGTPGQLPSMKRRIPEQTFLHAAFRGLVLLGLLQAYWRADEELLSEYGQKTLLRYLDLEHWGLPLRVLNARSLVQQPLMGITRYPMEWGQQ